MNIENMIEGKKYRKKELPADVVENLDSLLESGVLTKVGQRAGTRYLLAPTEKEPEWVKAAEAVMPEQNATDTDDGNLPASALTAFSLALGNRAALIVQMCDGLTNGTVGLTAISEIKGQALLLLNDLNLLNDNREG